MRCVMGRGFDPKRAFLVFGVVFFTLSCSVHFVLWSTSYFSDEKKEARSTASEPLPKPPRNTEAKYREFEAELKKILGEEEKNISVYLYCPDLDKNPYCYQARPMNPASMIKLFVLAKAMEDADDGKLKLTDKLTLTESNMVDGAGSVIGRGEMSAVSVKELLGLMISESDNTATNMLIDRLGMEEINKYLTENRYTDTILQHKMMLYNSGLRNYSSVRDIGDLLTKIYRHECVDEDYDEMMIEFLLKQQDRECFPVALPSWQIAHKTGEVTGVYNDGGIFYGSQGNFVLVIMSESDIGRAFVIEKMQAVAKLAAEVLP